MLSITVDTPGFLEYLSDVQQRQIPFAMNKGLNAVATDVQTAERAHLRDVFTLRREQWADRSIKITHFANKSEPWAKIAVAPPGDRGDILGKFEDQTQKTALGAHGVAIPVNALRTKSDIVKNNQRPKNLHLHREGGRIVGDNGTYIVNLPDGRELLLQRNDLGKRIQKQAARFGVNRTTHQNATLLFIFVPRVHLTPNLAFEATATRVVSERWDERFTEAWLMAMDTAR